MLICFWWINLLLTAWMFNSPYINALLNLVTMKPLWLHLLKKLLRNKFCEGARSGCCHLGAISNRRCKAWALVLSPWSFECEGCSYVPKYGEWHVPWQTFLSYILVVLRSVHRRQHNIGLCFWMRGDASDQTFGNCTFLCMWPYEDHIHGRCKVFHDLHWWILKGKSKGECFEMFKEFKTLLEMSSKYKIKAF